MSIDLLPADVFIYELTFLPFSEVINLCGANTKFHRYCSDPQYNNSWRRLIENTFGNIYNYPEKLKRIQQKLIQDKKLDVPRYNYLVYTQLINLLDPVTQLMIYHRQGDSVNFYDKKFNNQQRVLALFLLDEKEELVNYEIEYSDKYINFGPQTTQNQLDEMVREMANNGNMKGMLKLVNIGANLRPFVLRIYAEAAKNGYLDVLKYIIENKIVNNPTKNTLNFSFEGAAERGQLDVIKYLLSLYPELIHYKDDVALRSAVANDHIETVKFLISRKADVNARNGEALIEASSSGNLEMVKLLIEAGADVHAVNDMALRRASKFGHLAVVQYLVSKGANVYAMQDDALKLAVENKRLGVENYLRSVYQEDNEDNYQELDEYQDYQEKYQPDDYWSD